eukprot:1157303-Pelagomonas_calceolata.AAC.9
MPVGCLFGACSCHQLYIVSTKSATLTIQDCGLCSRNPTAIQHHKSPFSFPDSPGLKTSAWVSSNLQTLQQHANSPWAFIPVYLPHQAGCCFYMPLHPYHANENKETLHLLRTWQGMSPICKVMAVNPTFKTYFLSELDLVKTHPSLASSMMAFPTLALDATPSG